MSSIPAELIETLPAALQEPVSLYWQDWCQTCESQDLSLETPVPLSRVGRIWACSEFVARLCTRKPHLLKSLLDDGLESDLDLSDYTARIQAVIAEAAGNETAVMEALRLNDRKKCCVLPGGIWMILRHLSRFWLSSAILPRPWFR